MFDKCFKVDEENILTPLVHSVNQMHFDTKMLKIFNSDSELTKKIIYQGGKALSE